MRSIQTAITTTLIDTQHFRVYDFPRIPSNSNCQVHGRAGATHRARYPPATEFTSVRRSPAARGWSSSARDLTETSLRKHST